jgi:lipopolysaccharide biosynthesis glycosyltransferase
VVIPDLHQPDPLEISAKKEIQEEALKKMDRVKIENYNARAASAQQVARMNAQTAADRIDRFVFSRFRNSKEMKQTENSAQEPRKVDDDEVEEPPKKDISTRTNNEKLVSAVTTKEQESSLADANVLVVIISNRRDGIIPTLASIIITSSKPLDVVLIGEHKINEQVRNHFGNRINEFTSLSVKDITKDLESQGMMPIWTWPEWQSSMDPSWKNENTIHVGLWDDLPTHAHELNHLRFYLPYISVFQTKSYFYFLDDDILVNKDLGVLAQKTMEELDSSNGLVCPCNIWMWNSECFHFEFQSKKDYILSMPSLYGDRDVCKTDAETHYVPENYWSFVESIMPKGGKNQHAWNFGFSLFALKNWRDLKLTEKYEAVMRENYRRHVFPETSLSFGYVLISLCCEKCLFLRLRTHQMDFRRLGVAYIAFAGNVECWNDDYAKIRDGFGFIEWDRYEATFGQDFFKKVDVVHFTGPDKPWVNESRIETRAISPWLEMMEKEKMPIPLQLPEKPTDNLFTLLSSERSGAQWVMSVLDGHPQVCASGENDKPETGFPTDVLLPEGLPWYPYCSIKKGCTYEFAEKNVLELVSDIQDGIPSRCTKAIGEAVNSDPLGQHLKRMCKFVEALDGNFERSNIAKVWVDAFVHDDKSLTGCGCVRGVKAKGLKVMAEWIAPKGNPEEEFRPPAIILDDTRIHGSKIIRLKRRNLWARYKSMIMAQQTGMFHPTSAAEKRSQLASMNPVTIEIGHLEWNMKHMEFTDQIGDKWVKNHGSEVLWLEYEDCRANTADCFDRIYNFIGVDSSDIKGKRSSKYKSFFASFEGVDSSMDYIENRGEILELLGINGWDHFVSGEKYIPIQFLTYEEEQTIVETAEYMGINSTLYGQDKNAEGYGSKYSAVLPILKSMDEDSLVVVNNDRDGRVNFPVGDHEVVFKALYDLKRRFQKIVQKYPGSVILSTDDDCCASSLSHIVPGDLFQENGERKKRACSSGEPGCKWAGDEKAVKWQSFMKSIAKERAGINNGNIYLDTSLLGGKAGDLVKFIEALNISEKEDDRAVITDFMHRFPDRIFLDYKKQLFGASRKSPERSLNGACMKSDQNIAEERRLSVNTHRKALFMYSPRSLGCTDTNRAFTPKYPLWDDSGIDLRPILEHIPRVAEMKETVVLPPYYGREPDYSQGPEVPYVVSEEGILSSRLIRDRTENSTLFWRLQPTETILQVAHDVLMRENMGSHRWRSLKKTVRSGGFPYWAW